MHHWISSTIAVVGVGVSHYKVAEAGTLVVRVVLELSDTAVGGVNGYRLETLPAFQVLHHGGRVVHTLQVQLGHSSNDADAKKRVTKPRHGRQALRSILD